LIIAQVWLREEFPEMKCLLFCLALLTGTAAYPQDKGEPVSLHVKEVHRAQDEGTEKGTWYHITAVVESKTVVYSLKCDEFLSMEKREFAGRCFHLSAAKDYPARKFSEAINFWTSDDQGKGSVLILYEIVSEKEK
jgi:hypothetical protein